MRNKFLLVLACLCSLQAHATIIEKPLPNPAQEQQARAIFHELRCVVCEGQSLAESDAILAVQMREHIRTLLAQGKSHDEILASFRGSYGDRILMTPPLENRTLPLWAAPLILLIFGAALVRRATRTPKGTDHD